MQIPPWDPVNYGYFWWVEPTGGAAAYYALGWGGQLIEVVPQRHIVIVVSTNVPDPRVSNVSSGDLQGLVDVIVAAVKTKPVASPP